MCCHHPRRSDIFTRIMWNYLLGNITSGLKLWLKTHFPSRLLIFKCRLQSRIVNRPNFANANALGSSLQIVTLSEGVFLYNMTCIVQQLIFNCIIKNALDLPNNNYPTSESTAAWYYFIDYAVNPWLHGVYCIYLAQQILQRWQPPWISSVQCQIAIY